VTSLQPSALAPGLPTVTSAGLPGYKSSSILGIFAPAGTPKSIISLLNREFVRALNNPEVKRRLFVSGVEAVGSSSEELATTMKSEMIKWGRLIQDRGIHE